LVGFIAAYRSNRWYALADGAPPRHRDSAFWAACSWITVFALHLRIPSTHGFPPRWATPAVRTALTLPVITIALVMSASLIGVRSATGRAGQRPPAYRPRGSCSPARCGGIGVRNAAVPVISILGIELAHDVPRRRGRRKRLRPARSRQHAHQGMPNATTRSSRNLLVSTFAVLMIHSGHLVQRHHPRLRAHAPGR
jgi:hypothetical protein